MDETQFKELKEELTSIKSLMILQLIQNGASAKQIEAVLKVKKIAPSNIPKSFSIKKLKKGEDGE